METNNQFSLKGKTALVTGASYGIGFAIASAYVNAGAQIIFNDVSEELVQRGLEAYKSEGIEAHGYVCDVTDEAGVTAFLEKAESEIAPIDILVNNAGIIKRIPMHEMSAADFRKVIDVDLVGPFIMAKAVLPGMMNRRQGKIINICSLMSELGRETVSAYTAAKGGLKMLTKSIASEYVQHPVQWFGPGIYRNSPDGTAAGRRTPLQQLHHWKNACRPLGENRGSDRCCVIPGKRRERFCERPHPLCRWRHPGFSRKTAVIPEARGVFI
jgi:gluconate 5-dehydrogenase